MSQEILIPNPAYQYQGQVFHTREVLQADRTYYLRSDGNDFNGGRGPSRVTAWRTWQHALDAIGMLDFNQKNVTLQHVDEGAPVAFANNLHVPPLTGGGTLTISGSATPGRTTVDGGAAQAFSLDSTGDTNVVFQQMTVRGGGQGIIQANYNSHAAISTGMIFDVNGSFSGAHLCVHDRQALVTILGTSITISGSAAYFLFLNMGGAFIEASTLTLTGTPNFAGAFIGAQKGAAVQIRSNTFVGAATGKRYDAQLNGVIDTGTGNALLLPGNAAGTAVTGGQYA